MTRVVQQIPNLPAAVALSGSEQMELVQAGVSVRATVQQVIDLSTQDDMGVFVKKAGDTMTGPLVIDSGGGTTGLTINAPSDVYAAHNILVNAPAGAEMSLDSGYMGAYNSFLSNGLYQWDVGYNGPGGSFVIDRYDYATGDWLDYALQIESGSGRIIIGNALSVVGFAGFAGADFGQIPTAPTALTGDNSTKLATTAFVKAQGYVPSGSLGTMSVQNANAVAITGGAINGTTVGATTASTGAFTNLTATGTVSGAGFTTLLTPYALINSQVFTGTPSLPTGTIGVTQANADNSTKLATTAFVKAQGYQVASALGTMAVQNANAVAITGGAIDGTPIGATTPSSGAHTTLSASGTVSGAGFTTLLTPYALINSQVFTGTPSLPTGTIGVTQATADNSTKLATTAYVKAQGYATTASLGTMSTQNANAVAITGGAIDGTPIGATTRSSGAFTTLAANGAATFTNSLTASPASANVTFSPTGTGTVTINPATLGTINNMSVGATTPSTGSFTTLVATSINSTPIGASTPSTGAFTTLSATGAATFTGSLTASPANVNVTFSPTGTGTVTINPATLGTINNMTIGATTAAAGTFTNLTATGTVSGAGFTTLLTPYALVNSQVFTGTPSLPTGTIGVTQAAATNNTTLATTAYVKSQNYLTANQTVTLSGDVTGSGATAITATVVQLQGRPLAATAPSSGNLMGWNGSTWLPVAAGAAAAGGTANQIQYNNGGVLGGLATTGTFAGSNVVMSNSPLFANSISITNAAGTASITLSKFTGAFNNMILGRTNTFNRWNLSLGNSTTETGSSNIGSDFSLDRYDDSGAFIDRPFSIARTDGRANFSVNATFSAGITAGSSTFTNACTVAPSGAVSALLTLNKSSGSTGLVDAVEGQTAGSRRWLTIMGNGTTEGGSNAGSDFLINRYSDTAVFIDTPFQIIRSTGVATFANALVSGAHTVNGAITSTGNHTINATTATITLNKPAAGTAVSLYGQTNALNRWQLSLGGSLAEGGSNAGSDFAINRFADAGTLLDTPFAINRASGQINITGALVSASGILTLGSASPSVNALIYMNKTSGSASLTNSIYGQTGQSPRWIMSMGDSSAESGGNAGSNFSLSRFNDAGTYIDAPFYINRANGQVNFSQGVTAAGNVTGGTIYATAGQATLVQASGNGFINVCDSAGNNGGSYQMVLRGLGSAYTAQVNLSQIILAATLTTTNGTLDAVQGIYGRQAPGGVQGQVNTFFWNNTAIEWRIGTTFVGYLAFTSDYRIKKDVAPLSSMWERVKALNPISYTQKEWTPEWLQPKENGDAPDPLFENNDSERWGFIAHELQDTLIMDAATGVKDGHDVAQSPNPWTVIAVLTKALQEAMTRIEALEARP